MCLLHCSATGDAVVNPGRVISFCFRIMTLKQAHKDALQALLTPEHMPSLFTVTHGRLPNFVAEAQCGGAKVPIH